jgi:hypothetical protein
MRHMEVKGDPDRIRVRSVRELNFGRRYRPTRTTTERGPTA